MGPNEIQKLLHSKETIDKTKKQPTAWFGNDVTDNGLVSKINKQLMQLNIKKATQ